MSGCQGSVSLYNGDCKIRSKEAAGGGGSCSSCDGEGPRYQILDEAPGRHLAFRCKTAFLPSRSVAQNPRQLVDRYRKHEGVHGSRERFVCLCERQHDVRRARQLSEEGIECLESNLRLSARAPACTYMLCLGFDKNRYCYSISRISWVSRPSTPQGVYTV